MKGTSICLNKSNRECDGNLYLDIQTGESNSSTRLNLLVIKNLEVAAKSFGKQKGEIRNRR